MFGAIAGALTAASAIAGTVAAFKSADAAEQSASAQSQAAALARRQEALSNARQRRQLIRERRIAAANNLARGVATGAAGSSAMAGVQGALNTNFASNLSFLDQIATLSTQRSSFLDQAQQSAADSSIFGAASSLAFTGARVAKKTFDQTPTGVAFGKSLAKGFK